MKIFLAFISLITVGSLTASEDTENNLSLTFKIGEEYNSNLTIEELDIGSNESGYLSNIELLTNYRLKLKNDHTFYFGYEFSQSLHHEYTEFDTQNNGLSLGYEKGMGEYILSLDYSYYDTKLDGENLLTMNFFTPAISYMLNNNFLIRADYLYLDKQFDDFSNRDASSNGASLSAFYFFNNAKSYVRCSISNSSEDAISDELDFESITGAVSIKTPANWISSDAIFKASLKYSETDYDHITFSINELRAEQKIHFKSSLAIPYSESITVIGAYELIDRVSNLDIANYKENRAMVSMEFKF